jgi:hypothetical protein
VAGLKINSQEIENLILDECESASPKRNKVSSLTDFGDNQRHDPLSLYVHG